MSRRRSGHQRNVDGLRAAAERKHQEAEHKVDEAIHALLRNAEPITFRRISMLARVSTSWLYAQPEVKERITRLRAQLPDKPSPPAEHASDASNHAMVRALRQHVGELDNERRQLLARIRELEERIEVLYGELYAKPATMARPTE